MPKARSDVTEETRGQGTPGEVAGDQARELLMKPLPARRRTDAGANGPTVSMTSTEAQNGFGRVLELVARDQTVLITRHNAAQAVVISYDRYQSLTQDEDPWLDQLEAEYDELIAKMQAPQTVEGTLKALRASPEELGRFAVEAARERKNSR